MEAESRRPIARLSRAFRERPYEYEFFQAIRLLELAGSIAARENAPASKSVGADSRPDQEVARFRVEHELTFAPSAVLDVEEPDERSDRGRESRPLDVTVPFLGITGALGVLPRHYSALVAERLHYKDSTLADFLDLFHHRAVSFFYRAWRKYRLPFAFEHIRRTGRGDDDMSAALHALVGLGTPGLLDGLGRQASAWVYYSGYFARPRRTALGLECLLSEMLGVEVTVQQFVGSWIDLDPPDRTTLGGAAGLGQHSRLGESAVLGAKVWDLQSKVRIRGGPMSFEDYRRLRPGGERLAIVAELTKSYLGPKIAFEFEWEIARGEIPAGRLAGLRDDGVQLGQTSWLAADEPSRYTSKVAFAVDNSGPA